MLLSLFLEQHIFYFLFHYFSVYKFSLKLCRILEINQVCDVCYLTILSQNSSHSISKDLKTCQKLCNSPGCKWLHKPGFSRETTVSQTCPHTQECAFTQMQRSYLETVIVRNQLLKLWGPTTPVTCQTPTNWRCRQASDK